MYHREALSLSTNWHRAATLLCEMIIIVMGVSGSGKTTVGRELARRLGIAFKDADDFHPPGNLKKMSQGVPLEDADRNEWLRELAGCMQTWNRQGGAVLACSALKESHRAILKSGCNELRWVWLAGTKQQVRERLDARTGHFFGPELLDSQFRALEAPSYAVRVAIDRPVGEIVEKLVAHFG